MQLKLSPISVVLMAAFLVGCDKPAQQSSDVVASEADVKEKQVAADTVDTLPPKSMEERRELRRQLADQQAKKFERIETEEIEEADPVKGEVPPEILEEVISDVLITSVAEREDIKILRTESLIFSDGSLGCAKPGHYYTQAQIPGYRIVILVGRQRFDYRVPEQGSFILCDQPEVKAPSKGTYFPTQ